MIDLDGMGPGFDIVSRLAGEGGSNFKYINNETGASITIRGRSSGFIEPLTGRESSEPMHILLESVLYYMRPFICTLFKPRWLHFDF